MNPTLLMSTAYDTNSPAKTQGTIAAGRELTSTGNDAPAGSAGDTSSPIHRQRGEEHLRWLHCPAPPTQHQQIPNTRCVHGLKIPSQGTRKLLHHTLLNSTKTEGEGERKKKKSSAFSCEMDQGKARLLTPEESPISLLGCNPSEQMGSTSRGSRQI